MTACPKCGLEAKTLLHGFCTHKECPVRNAAGALRPAARTPPTIALDLDPDEAQAIINALREDLKAPLVFHHVRSLDEKVKAAMVKSGCAWL